jgi:hypothetical protein
MGRPNRFTYLVSEDLVWLVHGGLSLRAAAAEAGIGLRTVHDWLAAGRAGHPAFAPWAARMAWALEKGRRRRLLLACLRDQARARASWQAFLAGRETWWLERLGPCEFYRRRLEWLKARGHWDAFNRLVAELESRGFRIVQAP